MESVCIEACLSSRTVSGKQRLSLLGLGSRLYCLLAVAADNQTQKKNQQDVLLWIPHNGSVKGLERIPEMKHVETLSRDQ